MSHDHNECKSQLLEIKKWYDDPIGHGCKRSCCNSEKEIKCHKTTVATPSCERVGPFAWLVGGNDNMDLPNEQETEGGYTFGIIETEDELGTAPINFRTSDLTRARLYGDAANEIIGYQEPMAGRFLIPNGAIGWINVPTTTFVSGSAPNILTNVYLERPSNAFTMVITNPMINPAVVGPPALAARVYINDIFKAPQLLGAPNLFLLTTPPYQSFFFTLKVSLDSSVTPPTNLAPLHLLASASFMTSLTNTIYGPGSVSGSIGSFITTINTIILSFRVEMDALGANKYFLLDARGYLV